MNLFRALAAASTTAILAGGLSIPSAPANATCPDQTTICARKNPRAVEGGMGSGALSGSSVGAPSSGGAWASSPYYGVRATSTVASEASSMRVIESNARKIKVPWPNPRAVRARDMSEYRVYQIYYTKRNGGTRLYKYGITKVGEARPRDQLRNCAQATGVAECEWLWVRTEIRGWLRARRVEAGYAMKYKLKLGECPPGMKRCL